MLIFWILLPMFCYGQFPTNTNNIYFNQRTTHKCKSMNVNSMNNLNSGYNYNDFMNNYLRSFLVERIVGTQGHSNVQDHIRNSLNRIGGWTLEEDSFVGVTPEGIKPFNNIVAVLDPNAPRRLTLACHYDSKKISGIRFIGATDSAVPCAMLLDIAATMTPRLLNRQDSSEKEGDKMCFCQCGVLGFDKQSDVTLQLIFFDGEEAFQTWNSMDSLYGSRHLAAKWDTQIKTVENNQIKRLDEMDVMVLLDLIGDGSCKFKNWFTSSSKVYERMRTTEQELRNSGLLLRQQTYFEQGRSGVSGSIEDDHVPFMQRGVPILHLICYPFPRVWHTVNDNESALNQAEIHDILLMVKILVSEYLHITF